MTIKDAATNSLLMFVAATCVVLVVRALPSGAAWQAAPAATAGNAGRSVPDAPPTDGIMVYYFHTNTRCPTCETIEEYAYEAVHSGFSEELKAGQLDWKIVNYETPGNEHYATDFDLVAPNVVLVKYERGRPVDWKGLPEVWEHTADKARFTSFVQTSVREFLSSDKSPERATAADTAAPLPAAGTTIDVPLPIP